MNLFSTARVENGAGGPYHFVDSPEQGKYFEYPIVVKKIEGEEDKIIEEIQKGYLIGDKILRIAKVVIGGKENGN